MRLALVVALAGIVCACEVRGGEPPVIEGLILGEHTVIVGEDDQISGAFEFHDPDGDAERIVLEVRLPDDTLRVFGPSEVVGLINQEHGTVTFSLRFPRDPVGAYEITVWLVDEDDLESNRLTGTVYSRM